MIHRGLINGRRILRLLELHVGHRRGRVAVSSDTSSLAVDLTCSNRQTSEVAGWHERGREVRLKLRPAKEGALRLKMGGARKTRQMG